MVEITQTLFDTTCVVDFVMNSLVFKQQMCRVQFLLRSCILMLNDGRTWQAPCQLFDNMYGESDLVKHTADVHPPAMTRT